jgi:hypothetical protein
MTEQEDETERTTQPMPYGSQLRIRSYFLLKVHSTSHRENRIERDFLLEIERMAYTDLGLITSIVEITSPSSESIQLIVCVVKCKESTK